MERNLHDRSTGTKAGALLCPVCCVEYVEVKFDCELDGVVLRDVEALQCPMCKQEVLTPQQQQEVTNKLKTDPQG